MSNVDSLDEQVLASLYFDFVKAGVFITQDRCKQDLRKWHPDNTSIDIILAALEATPIEARKERELFARYLNQAVIQKFSN